MVPQRMLFSTAFGVAFAVFILLGTPAGVATPNPRGPSIASFTVAAAPSTSSPDVAGALGYVPAVLGALTAAHPLNSSTMISLGISLGPRNVTGLDQIAVEAATPSSPAYGHFLSREQYLAEYAPTASDYHEVTTALESGGLTPVSQYSDHLFLMVRGSAGAAERYFHTSLETGTYHGRTVVVPTSPPTLPLALRPYVVAVSGLSENVATFSFDLAPVPAVNSSEIYPDYPHFMYGLDHVYNLTASGLWATGETIGLVLWGDGYNPNDLTSFQTELYPSSQPSFTIEPVPLDGAPSPSPAAVNDPSQAPFELTLDMEWSESQAPGATLMPVYVPDGPASNHYSPSDVQLEDALNYLVNASVSVISMSFGSPDGQDLSFEQAMDNALQVAAARGISVFASSGDNGGSVEQTQGACSGTPEVEFPATSPWITSVGGTAPIVNIGIGNANTDFLAGESAWSSSTGGYSSTITAPAWQLQGNAGNLIRSQGGGHRGVPDVSGPSANNMLFYNSSVTAGEGTSFASPMWAGIAAEMDSAHGRGFGLLGPALYSLGAQQENGTGTPTFNDVTQGSNCIYSAGAGWDPVTGWGSPRDALVLYGNLIKGLLALSLSFNPSVATPGSSESVTVTASTASGPVGGFDVNVGIFSQPTLGEAPSLVTSLTVFVGNSGSGSQSFTVPISYAFDSLLVKGGVLTSNFVGSSSAILGVSVLGSYWGPLTPLLTWPVNILFFLALFILATLVGWALGRKKPVPVARRSPVRTPVRKVPTARPRPAPVRTVAGSPPAPARPVGAAPSPSSPATGGRTLTGPSVPVQGSTMPISMVQTYHQAPAESPPPEEVPIVAQDPSTEVRPLASTRPVIVQSQDIPIRVEPEEGATPANTDTPVPTEPEWAEPEGDLDEVPEGPQGSPAEDDTGPEVPEPETITDAERAPPVGSSVVEEVASEPDDSSEQSPAPAGSVPEVPGAVADETPPNSPEIPSASSEEVAQQPEPSTEEKAAEPEVEPVPELPASPPETVPPNPVPVVRKAAPRRATVSKPVKKESKAAKPARTDTKSRAKTPKTKTGSR